MKRYDPTDVRDFALLGHGGVGKTSLCEAMLFSARLTSRLGHVDDGTSTLDAEPEEHKRKITIHAALGLAEWKKCKLNFVDTPGEPSFGVEVTMALAAVDGALLVVSAPDGVQVGTERGWQAAEERGLPVAIVVNKMDRERASFERAVEGCKASLSEKATPVQLPIGAEAGFEGVIDLLAMKAIRFPGDGREPLVGEVPPALQAAARAGRDALLEAIASTDDALIEKYLETGELAEAEVAQVYCGVATRTLVPVSCASAARCAGVDGADSSPTSPVGRAPAAWGKDPKGGEVWRRADPAEPFSAIVFQDRPGHRAREPARARSGVLHADLSVECDLRQGGALVDRACGKK